MIDEEFGVFWVNAYLLQLSVEMVYFKLLFGILLRYQLQHNWLRCAVNTFALVGMTYVGKTVLKVMIKEERADHLDNKSFPSGHAAMAFAAARSIDKEFRKDCIWIPIAGYATVTSLLVVAEIQWI